MGRRFFSVAVASSLVVAGLVGVVPAAHATHCGGSQILNPKDPNKPSTADSGFIVTDGLDVKVDPSRADDYALAVLDYYVVSTAELALCETNALAVALCIADKATEIVNSFDPTNNYFRYAYQDPEGGWVLGGNQAADDAQAFVRCVNPSIT